MYIIRNALKCIGRSPGRNILIGIIVTAIAVSSCIALSIRQASETAKADALDRLSITATISFDRTAMMGSLNSRDTEDGGGFDRSQFKDSMGSSLTLDEYLYYAQSESVQELVYTETVYADGSEGFDPVSSEEDTDDTEEGTDGDSAAGGGRMGKMSSVDSDFQIVGYGSDSAMTDFVSGTARIVEGEVFAEGGTEPECIITQELAVFNGISVGDTITVTNPDNGEEKYSLTVVGIYTDSSANDTGSYSFLSSTAADPANKICMSYAALEAVLGASEDVSGDTAMSGTLSASYVIGSVEDYEKFQEDVREMGLEDSYTVSSSDLTAYESSLAPLDTLSTMAGWFLAVILAIGAIVLVVLNIFSVRERKYEIGVLTAMGMKKWKVAVQFLTEILVVTVAAVLIGSAAGAAGSGPVTDALLSGQVAAREAEDESVSSGFGRDSSYVKGGSGGKSSATEDVSYITEVGSGMNLTVAVQLLGIAVLLTLAGGTVSMLSVLKYEPLKILTDRD